MVLRSFLNGRLRAAWFTPGLLLLLVAQPAGALAQEPQERPEVRARAAANRGWVGISLESSDGVFTVTAVGAESPAERAGIRAGDRITAWNGRSDVARAIASGRVQPGEEVRIRVEREGAPAREFSLVAEQRPVAFVQRLVDETGEVIVIRPQEIERRMRVMRDSIRIDTDEMQSRLRILLADSLRVIVPDAEEIAARVRAQFEAIDSPGLAVALASSRGGVAGAQLTDLSEELGSYFGAAEGVLVLRVGPDTPAARAGLREGDVIVSAGDTEIATTADVRRAVARSSGEVVPLVVLRRGERIGIQLGR